MPLECPVECAVKLLRIKSKQPETENLYLKAEATRQLGGYRQEVVAVYRA
jgi:hypothetical protein